MSPWGLDALLTFTRTEMVIVFAAGIVIGVIVTLAIVGFVSAHRC